jgi:transcriptional regulator
MYVPAHFDPPPAAGDGADVLHAFIRQYPLAALVTSGADGLDASHVPVILHADAGAHGMLRCHLARANPQWKTIGSSTPVLAIFQGSEHYITPSWYVSKQEHGKVVPTWNYIAVHIRGKATLFEEPAALLHHLQSLTDQNEAPFAQPWSIHDAPEGYIAALTKAIVGVEISIESIEGKWKASQNRPPADRQAVVAGLRSLHSPAGTAMAELVKQMDPG